MCSPSASAIFVGGASLLHHLPPKFSVTFTFTITGTEFGNCATYFIKGTTKTLFHINVFGPMISRIFFSLHRMTFMHTPFAMYAF